MTVHSFFESLLSFTYINSITHIAFYFVDYTFRPAFTFVDTFTNGYILNNCFRVNVMWNNRGKRQTKTTQISSQTIPTFSEILTKLGSAQWTRPSINIKITQCQIFDIFSTSSWELSLLCFIIPLYIYTV